MVCTCAHSCANNLYLDSTVALAISMHIFRRNGKIVGGTISLPIYNSSHSQFLFLVSLGQCRECRGICTEQFRKMRKHLLSCSILVLLSLYLYGHSNHCCYCYLFTFTRQSMILLVFMQDSSWRTEYKEEEDAEKCLRFFEPNIDRNVLRSQRAPGECMRFVSYRIKDCRTL